MDDHRDPARPTRRILTPRPGGRRLTDVEHEVVWSGSSWRDDPRPQIGTLPDRYQPGQVRRVVQPVSTGPMLQAALEALILCLRHGAQTVAEVRAASGFRKTTLWKAVLLLEAEGRLCLEAERRAKGLKGRPRTVIRFVG